MAVKKHTQPETKRFGDTEYVKLYIAQCCGTSKYNENKTRYLLRCRQSIKGVPVKHGTVIFLYTEDTLPQAEFIDDKHVWVKVSAYNRIDLVANNSFQNSKHIYA